MGKRRREKETRPPDTPQQPPYRSYLPLVFGALIVAAVGGFFAFRPASRDEAPPDVILITIDTLRADALGFAGNREVQTPFLDRMAERGIVFTNAHAHNVVTLPSHVNILTGLYPYQHGVRDNAGFRLEEKFKTIATTLRENGYATGAFVGAFPLDARYGLNRGFDVYDDKYREGVNPLSFEMQERPAHEVLEAATAWYRAQQGQKRFLWIHLYDPHAPYRPPPEWAAKYASSPYLGEVAATDAALERYIRPLLEESKNPFMIVTADHGEALGDHGEATHGLFAYEATLKVPLIVYDASREKGSVEARPARHVDIVPTILDRLGVAIPAGLPGHSLLDIAEERDTYFESLSTSLNRGWAPLIGMIQGNQKYIDLPIPELYDLKADPAESKNLYTTERRAVTRIRKKLAEASPSAAAAKRTISEEESAKLLSLGYVAGSIAKKNYTEADDPKNLIDIDTKMHKVVELYQYGKLDESIALARELVRLRPDMPLVQEMLAFVLQQSEQSQDAAAMLRRAIAEGNATDSMKIRLGLMLSESGDAAEAVRLLEPYASREDPATLNAYGIALADMGRAGEAIQQFNRILTIDPTNATAFQNLGIVALRTGDRERARGFILKALELNDRMPLALNTLGVIFAQEGKYPQAIDAWSRAVANDPKLFDALFNLGLVARQVGRRDIARDALARFVEGAPRDRYGKDLEKARAILAGM